MVCSLLLSSLALTAAPLNYFTHLWQTEDGLPQNSVTAIVQTRDGYLWLGTYSGLARFDGVRFVPFNNGTRPKLNRTRITSLFEDSQGTLWIGNETGEVTRFRNRQLHHRNRALMVLDHEGQEEAVEVRPTRRVELGHLFGCEHSRHQHRLVHALHHVDRKG